MSRRTGPACAPRPRPQDFDDKGTDLGRSLAYITRARPVRAFLFSGGTPGTCPAVRIGPGLAKVAELVDALDLGSSG